MLSFSFVDVLCGVPPGFLRRLLVIDSIPSWDGLWAHGLPLVAVIIVRYLQHALIPSHLDDIQPLTNRMRPA